MLDMITDFWKPTNKKPQLQENVRPEEVRLGSSLVFGFVPQASLSGQRLVVSAINTYQFGEEKLTSFSLSNETPTGINNIASMIFAESDGEYYLAISRRILAEERDKLFDKNHLQSVMDDKEVSRLPLREIVSDFKGWTVASYKREIQGMKGRFFRGDYRRVALPAASEGQQFDYMLLVSDSNEHAIEIEKYEDGRTEIYTTVYRRMSDIGEVSYNPVITPVTEAKTASNENGATVAAAAEPKEEVKAEIKVEAKQEPLKTVFAPINPAPVASSGPVLTLNEPVADAPAKPAISEEAPKPEPMKWPELSAKAVVSPVIEAPEAAAPEVKADEAAEQFTPLIEAKPEPKLEPVQLAPRPVVEPKPAPEIKQVEFVKPVIKVEEKPIAKVEVAAVTAAATSVAEQAAAKGEAKPAPVIEQPKPITVAASTQEVKAMNTETTINGVKADMTQTPTNVIAHPNASTEARPEIRAVSKPGSIEPTDAIECELRVANKIIDEAIRNEMRLGDVVRRIIELPVANPESVHIPMTLTEEDYALLAIRYAIPASDKNAIKRRIIEDLNDFSGANKKTA